MIPGLVGAILLIAALGTVAGRVGRGSSDDAPARRILDARAADGDISPAQRDEMLAVLSERPSMSRGRWLPWLLATAGLALLVVPAAFPASAGDAGWGNHWTAMADHMGWNGASTTTTASPEPGAPEITVEAGDLWFRPQTIEIPTGGTINLTVHNTGEAFHDLTITDLDLQLNVEAGETTTNAISVDTPGTYEFICSVPGHAAGGMRGELIVTDTDA